MEKLFIPTMIKVGYEERSDTYTNKLAYVIYYDSKGKLRKETSWENWRDKNINPDDFQNVPTEGFILNRNVGGVRSGWSSWDTRAEKVRVFDPRGFEFEISIPNMLFILQECTSTKGKGLEGQFVYAWDGKELMLLPVDCNEYKESADFTVLQSQKISKTDMVPGYYYKFKDTSVKMYLGRYDYYEWKNERHNDKYEYKYTSTKKHIFIDDEGRYYPEGGFTKIASIHSDVISEEFADRVVAYTESKYNTYITSIVERKIDFDFYNELKIANTWSKYKLILNENRNIYFKINGMYAKFNNIDFGYYFKGQFTENTIFTKELIQNHKIQSIDKSSTYYSIKDGVLSRDYFYREDAVEKDFNKYYTMKLNSSWSSSNYSRDFVPFEKFEQFIKDCVILDFVDNLGNSHDEPY